MDAELVLVSVIPVKYIMTKVKNINGTSDNRCSCGSWMKHWINFSNKSVIYCVEKSCINKNLVGAHVQKSNSYDHNWYIIPLCIAHNASDREIEIIDSCTLVTANKKLTCEK